MSRNPIPRVLATALLIPALACSDSGTSPAGDDLTDSEFEALIEALAEVGTFSLDLSGPAAASDGKTVLAADLTEFDLSESVPCPLGGSVDVEGTFGWDVDEGTGITTMSISSTTTHRSCQVRAPSSGMEFELNGNPRMTTQVSAEISEMAMLMSISGTESGAIRWEKGDKSGTCAVDLEYAISDAGSAEPTVSVEGSICGRAVQDLIDD
jgi:hypothetical protein